MPYAPDRAARRHGRDRDLLPERPRVGPYEAPYDVRRGYQQPLGPATRTSREETRTLFFRGRDEEREG